MFYGEITISPFFSKKGGSTMNQFLQQLINGLSLGSIYALIALGYTMVYGIIKLINFAHGDIYMIGAYSSFYITRILGYKDGSNLGVFVIALVATMIICGITGMIIERIAYKPLRHATRIAALITAIGVSYFIEYMMQFFIGAEPIKYPQLIPNNAFHLGPVRITAEQITIFVITIALMLLLEFIINKTKMGRAMRAVSVDEGASQLMGINVDTTISFTFLLGSALAGVAGILVGVYYNTMNPLMGFTPGLKAFIAAVFGGIGSVPGAMIGGFFVGFAETMVIAYGSSLWKDAIVYVILILILILKPEGLLGKNEREKV